MRTSTLAPFNTVGVGLYLRMWLRAFPDVPVFDAHAAELEHYEALRADRIDELEALTRHKLADPRRVLGVIECGGRHHAEPVSCRYAALSSRGLPALATAR
ncbi:hypothetical protein [Dactylosporangium sp. NPDC049140]|uniref:hypothetical protein n=1 Tax=Dactylosporangium sp. NPDC049140 TaxID=3155647 RepID=UPI003406B860